MFLPKQNHKSMLNALGHKSRLHYIKLPVLYKPKKTSTSVQCLNKCLWTFGTSRHVNETRVFVLSKELWSRFTLTVAFSVSNRQFWTSVLFTAWESKVMNNEKQTAIMKCILRTTVVIIIPVHRIGDCCH